MNRPIQIMLAVAASLLLLAGVASAQSNLANCKYYTKTQQDFAAGLDYCKDCVDDEPDNPEARYYGAWCMAEMGMYEEAYESFDWLIQRKDSKSKKIRKHAKWAGERVQNYFATHFNKGVEHLKEEDWLNASSEFEKATQINPKKASGWLNYGYAEDQQGFSDSALKAFEKAVERSGEKSRAVANEYLSVALQNKITKVRADQNHDPEELAALETRFSETLDAVLAADPSNDAALLQLADLELAKGNQEKAFELIEQSVDIDPGNLNKLYNVGVGYYEAENWEAAIAAFSKTAELVDDPGDALWVDATFNKALVQTKAEMWEGSVETLGALIEMDGTNVDYKNMMGQSQMKLGNRDVAMEYFKEVQEMEEAASAAIEAPEGSQ